jgi:SpoVK/Ycf46/Vps4 family AAA+-type ATPase
MNREFEELTRLLLLRALHFKDCIYRFVGKDGFSERHVARLLNLNHWLGENENGFITEAQCPKWNRREVMKELNQQWQAAEAKKSDKSELIKVIAREMRAQLYEIACEDENREAVGPYGRTDAVVRAIEIMRGRRALLLFDEAEDIFSSASFFSKSFASERKGWTNRMLENNPVPVFWISNNIRNLDPAFSRRFDFIFQVKPPPRHQRKQVYRKICGSHAPADLIEKIAASEVLTPAVVARATKVAVSTCQRGNLDDFRQIFEERLYQTLKAQGHNAHTFMKSLSIVPAVYGLDFLNASMDLHSLAPALKQRPDCRICLYGPSGTGKTTLGHWLSEATNRPIHVKKASDLLTPYLGETEQALARAFENAEQDGAILMIDEVDSFLQDRRSAERSWEVQQVNELLTQMERFSGTFIASTNLIDSIDAAAFRRFDFKLRFDYLKQEQVTGLFERYSDQLGLGCSGRAASRKMGELGNCTPGDFANVARQHRVQPFMDADAFAQAIIGECQQKNQSAGRKLGFL